MKKTALMGVLFSVLVSVFLGCRGVYSPSSTTTEYNILDSTQIYTDASLVDMIQPYSEGLEAQMNRVLNTSEVEMFKARPEGLLSNFVADLIFEEVNEILDEPADFCLLNHGGLRRALPKGNITVGNIYELMPFDNEAVAVELSADKVKEIFSYLSNSGGEPVSNLQLNLSKPEEGLIGGKAVQNTTTYQVITSDYLANGGDKMYFFDNPINKTKTGLKIRDLIIEHIEEEQLEGKTLKSSLDERITK